jgi:hypothetical protein
MGKLGSGNRKGIAQGHILELITEFDRNMGLLTPTSLFLSFIILAH